MVILSLCLFGLSVIGLVLVAIQLVALTQHLDADPVEAERQPPVSILKPLCGEDDDLLGNLSCFAHLDHPQYELLLGVKDTADPAYSLALQAQVLWPEIVRVVVQSGAPGLNPKVNQLISLTRAARYDVLVVSDSNVRVAPDYLTEICGYLDDSQTGLVTHPITGLGERNLGALLDNLNLSTSIGPGVIAAKRVLGVDFVVAKSLAMRRGDLQLLGGFEAVKDVLAEDFVLGRRVANSLGKRIVLARTPILNVTRFRSVPEFVARYARWSVLQRTAMGIGIYCCELLLNPVVLATTALVLQPSRDSALAWTAVALTKMGLDGRAAGQLRNRVLDWGELFALPLKDLLLGVAWLQGLISRYVDWRGNRLLVAEGTQLIPVSPLEPELGDAAVSNRV
jgi:ceramide glucosyltransferase